MLGQKGGYLCASLKQQSYFFCMPLSFCSQVTIKQDPTENKSAGRIVLAASCMKPSAWSEGKTHREKSQRNQHKIQ